MKKYVLLLFIIALFTSLNGAFAQPSGEYGVVIEGYDWGPAVNKVILSLEGPATSVDGSNYKVMVQRSSDSATIPAGQVLGSRTVIAG
ncbi:MAG: hypothetical protein WD037_10440, partial [Balneolales bacterium]